MTVSERAPAKINLALHVRHRRDDGYHDLETLFAFCTDGDGVDVSVAAADAFEITGPLAGALTGEANNLVTRAASAFCAAFAVDARHAIRLDKHLPVASGIGGGSADAAATLRALARLHNVALDDPALFTVAAGLGADVPACLLGRPSLGTGRGDALVPLAMLGALPVLLVNPRVAVSTAAVFKAWDGVDGGAIPEGETLVRAVAGRNDLERPARALAPVIDEVLAVLSVAPDAVLARMSGSGATCFAVFGTVRARDATDAQLASSHPGWWRLASTLA